MRKSSVLAILLAIYMCGHALISSFFVTAPVSFMLLLFISFLFAFDFHRGRVEPFLISFVSVLILANGLGLLFSPHSIRYDYAFYRLFPFFAAWAVYRYCLPKDVKRVLIFFGLSNALVSISEFYFGADIFPISEELHYAHEFGGRVRSNGLFDYSLPFSSFLVFSAILICTIYPERKDVFFVSMILVGSFFSFNKMNVLLIVITLAWFLYSFVFRRRLKLIFDRVLVDLAVVALFFVFLWLILEPINQVWFAASEANEIRAGYWGAGIYEFLRGGPAGVVFGLNLGIYEKYQNGFESQYIQFLAEYGMVGLIIILLFLIKFLRVKAYLIVLVLCLEFVTLRPLDNYSSAFVIYLLFFYSDNWFRARAGYSVPR